MNLKILSARKHSMDRSSRLSRHGNFYGAIAFSILAFLPIHTLHATSYGPLGLAELVEKSDLIFVAELVPSGDQLNARIGEVLKGVPQQDFTFTGGIITYQSEGKEQRFAAFDGDVTVKLDDLALSNRRIFFLRADPEGRLYTFHPACMEREETKPRVFEILAMNQDPAPFVKSEKHAGDVNLIYVLGSQFHALSFDVPPVPDLNAYFRANLSIAEEMPWQRTRLTLPFTFRLSRNPTLQLATFEAKGAVPDYIRKLAAIQGFTHWVRAANENLPPEFSMTIDTNGPGRVGGLPFAEAAAFLREQLRSGKLEVIEAAYHALGRLMDAEAVPIANEMLRHPDRGFRRQAARFLAHAKDPRSIEPLCAAIDELALCIRYASEGYDREEDELSSALGEAVLKLRDPRVVPALKRAALKGYAGDWMAMTLARLGDESAFEPLLSHMRNPKVDHYAGELITMVDRSNLHKEPWMLETFSSEERAAKQRQSIRWLEWWEAHKVEFKIIRTWEEACKKSNQ